MIEEPEISLHPQAQLDLVRMFADAVERGKQVLLTTHSQTLILALSELSQGHSLKPENVAIYHVSRGVTGSEVRKLPMNKNWYVEGWIPSFAQVESRLMKEWMENLKTDVKPGD